MLEIICGFIIVLIIILEVYFHFNPPELQQIIENKQNIKEERFDNPEPWSKIKYQSNGNLYHIKIKNFTEHNYVEWKDIIDDLDYDIDTKELIILSKDNCRAISIVNLIISNINGEISIEEIVKEYDGEPSLINKTIMRSRKKSSVCEKLLNLVLMNNSENFTEDIDLIDTEVIDTNNVEEIKVNENIDLSNQCKYSNDNSEESSYNYEGFDNKHYSIFSNDKLIRNNLSATPYLGKQYASPFRN